MITENEKYVLFSPIGTHDPLGVPLNNVPSEGSMLHIIRHYKPEAVYLYITKELNYGDNRYEEAIKKFYPDCEVYNIISEIDENDVNNYDIFMYDFKKYIDEMHKKYSGYKILLNISSGTPQMKSSLILEVISSNIKLIPIQVTTPTKKKNFEDNFKYEDLDKIDENNENIINRCNKVEVLSFKRSKMQSQIESLVNNYEYSAALQILKEDESSLDLFKRELSLYLEHCIYRSNSQFERAKQLFLDNNIEVIDYSNNDNTVREFFEYFYIMKIKQSKGLLSDFILRITPFITKLLFYYLNDICKLDIEKYINIFSSGTRFIKRELIKKYDKELLRFLDRMYENSKFKDTFLNFNTLIDIALFYHKQFDNGIFYDKDINLNEYKGIYSLFKHFDQIEKERNKVAHTMIDMDEDCMINNLHINSYDTLCKCQALLIKILNYKKNYFVYDEINRKIFNLLQKIN